MHLKNLNMSNNQPKRQTVVTNILHKQRYAGGTTVCNLNALHLKDISDI